MSTTFLFIIFALSKGITSLDVITPSQINVTLNSNSSVVLNCTFDIETNATIVRVTWKKERGSGYTDLVEYDFSLSKIVYFIKDFQKRSNSSIGRNSTSFICVINDVRCQDDGNYRCSVTSDEGSSRSTRESNSTVYIHGKADIPFQLSLQPNHSVEENNVFNVTCMAHVGDPQGKVALWKRRTLSDQQPYFIGESSVSENKKENCLIVSQLTVPLNLTRDDLGVYIECSSKHNQTQDSTLSRHIGPLDILYGPSTVSITASRPYDNLTVGEKIRLTCTTNGNPTPNFTWILNSTVIVDSGNYKFDDKNAILEVIIKSSNDSGYYYCLVTSNINDKVMEMNSSVFLRVSRIPQLCSDNLCSYFESCYEKDDTTFCSVNSWKVTAFVFIALSLILGFASTSLLFSLRLRKHKLMRFQDDVKISNVLSTSADKFGDFGGYADPKDVQKPNKQNKGGNEGHDNPYADPVDMKAMYTSVQKSSSPDSSTDDSTSQSSPDQVHLSDPANNVISESTPKPPNVYDDAWV